MHAYTNTIANTKTITSNPNVVKCIQIKKNPRPGKKTFSRTYDTN